MVALNSEMADSHRTGLERNESGDIKAQGRPTSMGFSTPPTNPISW